MRTFLFRALYALVLCAAPVASAATEVSPAGPAPHAVNAPPAYDPNCDYGYPYSGSGRYFAEPLTDLRHSEPLGALLGYHLRYPC